MNRRSGKSYQLHAEMHKIGVAMERIEMSDSIYTRKATWRDYLRLIVRLRWLAVWRLFRCGGVLLFKLSPPDVHVNNGCIQSLVLTDEMQSVIDEMKNVRPYFDLATDVRSAYFTENDDIPRHDHHIPDEGASDIFTLLYGSADISPDELDRLYLLIDQADDDHHVFKLPDDPDSHWSIRFTPFSGTIGPPDGSDPHDN